MESSIMEEEKMEEENTENQNYPITIQTEEPIQSSIKDKISNVLHHNNFCGICLELSDELLPLTSQLQFPEQEYSMTVGDLLRQVFGNALPNVIFQEKLCQICLRDILNIYTYIEVTKSKSRLMNYYLLQLSKELCVMENKVSSDDGNNMKEGLLLLSDPRVQEKNEQCSIEMEPEEESVDDESKIKKLICDCCHVSYRNKKSLIFHFKQRLIKENNVKQFICDCCKKPYSSKGSLVRHLSNPNIKNRNSTIFFDKRTCTQCHTRECEHEKYITAMYIQAEIKKKRNIKCPDCDFTVLTRFKHKKKIMIKHANKAHLKKPSAICEKCGLYLYGVNDYKQHLKKRHSAKSQCPHCARDILNNEMKKHVTRCKTIQRPYPCDRCSATFKSKLSLTVHNMTKHDNIKTTVFYCNLCNYRTQHSKLLSKHKKTHQESDKDQNHPELTCPVCNETLQIKSKYIKHVIACGIDARLICKVCYVCCDSLEQKEEHKKTREHIDNCPHKCKECEYGAVSFCYLIKHVNRVHKKVAPYVCEVCDKSFCAPTSFANHQRTHDESSKKFECHECGAMIKSKSGLNKHIYRFHETDKLLQCPHCDRGFVSDSSRKEHILNIHTNQKNCVCPLCSFRSSTLNRVRQHLKKVHWKKKEKFDIRQVEGLTIEDLEMLRDRRRGLLEQNIAHLR